MKDKIKLNYIVIEVFIAILIMLFIMTVVAIAISDDEYDDATYSQIENEYVSSSNIEVPSVSLRLSNASAKLYNSKKSEYIEIIEDTENDQYNDEESEEVVKLTEYYEIPISEYMQDQIRDMAEYFGIPVDIVYKIMYIESGFDQYAVSSTGDHGIMQLNELYYDYYAYNIHDEFDYIIDDGFNVYDVLDNVLVGLRGLNEWVSICSSRGYYDYADILECYNRGYYFFDDPYYRNYSTVVLSVELNTYYN